MKMSPSEPRPGRSLGIAVMLGGTLVGIISLMGLLIPDKARLLHFPALIIGLFLVGAGIALFFGLSSKPSGQE